MLICALTSILALGGAPPPPPINIDAMEIDLKKLEKEWDAVDADGAAAKTNGDVTRPLNSNGLPMWNFLVDGLDGHGVCTLTTDPFFVEVARLCREGGKTQKERRAAMVERLNRHLAKDLAAWTKGRGNNDGSCPDLAALSHCFGDGTLGPTPFQAAPGNEESSGGATAIILPYRNREVNFQYWLFIMIPLLVERMDRPFGVFLVEEENFDTRHEYESFNLGLLKNAGVREAKKASPRFDCFVTADIDYVLVAPDDELKGGACQFTCVPENILHYSSNRVNHKCRRHQIGCRMGVAWTRVGGVIAGTWEQWKKTDGFPMNCWSWGDEDISFTSRIQKAFGNKPIEWAQSNVADGQTSIRFRHDGTRFLTGHDRCDFWDLDTAGHNHENLKEARREKKLSELYPAKLNRIEKTVELQTTRGVYCGAKKQPPFIRAGSPGAAGLSFDGYKIVTHQKTALYTHIGIEGNREAIDDYTWNNVKDRHWHTS
jgi:hypothetical protein